MKTTNKNQSFQSQSIQDGIKLKTEREKLGMSKYRVSELTGLSSTTIENIEQGRHPTIVSIRSYAAVLGYNLPLVKDEN